AAGQTAAEATARARLLDLPAATLGETAAAAPRIHRNWPVSKPRPGSRALVVDLTSMWAGPLCAQLLRQTGAVVVKVESPRRPDGTRAGNRAFFDWMNGGKLLCGTDFDSDTRRLHALLSVADVVLEGSRPAALSRRGLGPYDVPARPGKVWVRITGHGADDAHAGLVAFGDDAAVSGGLVAGDTEPVFCGDAIADPLTGLEAARQVTASRARGGGELIEISMAAVAAHYAGLPRSLAEGPGTEEPLTQPEIPCSAGLLGADNAAVARIVAERQSVPC
ncbi:MAG: CoA transferase, partial [Mycobacterium sp.]|nr:CoA transferase [Mycobacterium sp.]